MDDAPSTTALLPAATSSPTRAISRCREMAVAHHLWDNRHALAYAPESGRQVEVSSPWGIAVDFRKDQVLIRQDGRTVEAHPAHEPLLRQSVRSVQAWTVCRLLGEEPSCTARFTRSEDRFSLWVDRVACRLVRTAQPTYGIVHDVLDRLLDERMAVTPRTNDSPRLADVGVDAAMKADLSRVIVSHPDVGSFPLASTRRATTERLRRELDQGIATSLSMTPRPVPIMVADGNARMTRLLSLCREALEIDPDMTDSLGNPLRPLLEVHIPAMFAQHAQAGMIAPEAMLADLDRDLERGIAAITRSVEDALKNTADDRADALATRISFLETRHPAPDALLPSALPTDGG